MLALIPARSGSLRIPNKNIELLGGHPLLAYSVVSALNSGFFSEVVVSTDSISYAEVARYYGASVPGLRPEEISQSLSPDREWVKWIFDTEPGYLNHEYACIIRPTSPFRTSKTIKRAVREFKMNKNCDTLRAVRKTKEHPGKMWVRQGNCIIPLIPLCNGEVPMHSNQTAALFEVYVQDASLEIFSSKNFLSTGQITGNSILPFFSSGHESMDINHPEDLITARALLRAGLAKTEKIIKKPLELK